MTFTHPQKRLVLIAVMVAIASPSFACEASRVVNEKVVRKLCPNKNDRCKARDNPEFYFETDPAFYFRITKPDPKFNPKKC